jgi:hypothetical protein
MRYFKRQHEAFANIAKLGEKCNNATCEDNTTCFRKGNAEDQYCMTVVKTGEKGCSEKHHTCTQNNKCIDDTCRLESNIVVAKKPHIHTAKKSKTWTIPLIIATTVGGFFFFLSLILIIVLLFQPRAVVLQQ